MIVGCIILNLLKQKDLVCRKKTATTHHEQSLAKKFV